MSSRRRDADERGRRRRSRSRSPVVEVRRRNRDDQDDPPVKLASANIQSAQWNRRLDDKGVASLTRRPEFDRGNAGEDRDRDWRGRRDDRRDNISFGASRDREDSFRSQPPGRFDRGPLVRGGFNNANNDRRFDSRGGRNFSVQNNQPGQMRGNYPSSFGGGFGAGGSEFGQRRGGARFTRGRGGPERVTIVYRPGEEDDTPKLNLFDPTKVPKGRSYFSHDDRERDDDRWAYRPARGRGRPYGWRTDDDRGAAPPVRRRSPPSFGRRPVEDVWKHDMFQDAEQESDKVDSIKQDPAVEENTADVAD